MPPTIGYIILAIAIVIAILALRPGSFSIRNQHGRAGKFAGLSTYSWSNGDGQWINVRDCEFEAETRTPKYQVVC